jgi:hypothetical protein
MCGRSLAEVGTRPVIERARWSMVLAGAILIVLGMRLVSFAFESLS